jgi:putative hydrolase of the HAD superfamily
LIRAVLFDYGGTLVQMERPWSELKPEAIRSEYAVLSRNGLAVDYETYLTLNESAFRKYAGLEAIEDKDIPDATKYLDLVGGVFPSMPRDWQEHVAAQANEAFWRTITDNLSPRADARATLERLRSLGLRLSVVSNHHNAQSLRGHLGRLQLSLYFSHILASSELGFRKPDPRIIAKSLELLGVRGDEALFVGDSREFDVEGAKRAGVRSILILNRSKEEASPGPEPDFTVHNLGEVPNIVTSL